MACLRPKRIVQLAAVVFAAFETLVRASYYLDDTDGSITYMGFWRPAPSSIFAGGVNLYNGTSMSAQCSTKDNCTMIIPFNGSGITLYVLPIVGVALSFNISIDGGTPTYHHSDGTSHTPYTVTTLFPGNHSLLPGNHTLLLTLLDSGLGGNTSPIYFDYAFVDNSTAVNARSTTSIGPSSDAHSSTASASNPSTESASTSRSKIGPIIGGIVGGMIAISIAIFILFWMRRRARRGDTIPIDPDPNILVSDISIVGPSHRPSSTVIDSDPNILVSNADRIPVVGTINRLSSQGPSNAPSGSSQNSDIDQLPQSHDTSTSPQSTLPLLLPLSGRHSTSAAPNPRSASDSALAAEEAHFLRRLYDRNAPADEIGELLRSMRARESGMATSSRDAARGSAPPAYNLSG